MVLGGSGDYYLSDIAIAKHGKLILTGVSFGITSGAYLALVDPDTGALDPAFHGGHPPGFNVTGDEQVVPTALAFTSDGDIVVTGASGIEPDMRPFVAIVTRQGEFLPSFHAGQPARYNPCVFYFGDCAVYAAGVEVLPGGKLLVAGYAYQDAFVRVYTMRLHADGTPDASYGPNIPGQQGYAVLPSDDAQYVASMLLQDGQVVLAGGRDVGGTNGLDAFVTRLSDGSLFRDGFDAPP